MYRNKWLRGCRLQVAGYKFYANGFLFLLICSVSLCCNRDKPYYQALPKGFPAMKIPKDNQLTEGRIKLGKLLFFDKRLSYDSSIACSSCHRPENAFCDTVPVSAGVQGRHAVRNAISLGNVGYQPYMFYDGGVPVLELQVLTPIGSHEEMDFNIPALIKRLAGDQQYHGEL